MVWPLPLEVDSTIRRLAPGDLTKSSPLAFIEFQVVSDEEGNPVTRVIYQDWDRHTHYVWPDTANLQPATVALGSGIGLNQPCTFHRDTFKLGPEGLEIDIDLTDPHGRRLTVELTAPRPWSGFSFAAPPAAGITNPTSFFVPYLTGFDFVTRPCSYRACFDDQPLRFATAPLLRHGHTALALKPATGVRVVEWLADGARPLTADDPGVVTDNAGHLVRLERSGIVLSCSPALPSAPKITTRATSSVTLSADGRMLAGGTLTITPSAGGWDATIELDQGWSGHTGNRMVTWLTKVVRFLRTWPRHYRWAGRLEQSACNSEGYRLSGSWYNAHPIA